MSPNLPAAAAGLKKLKVTPQRDGDVTRFIVENFESTEVTVTFDLQLENLRCSTNTPFTTVVPPRRPVEVCSLQPVNARLPWKYNYTSRYTIGSTLCAHDDTVVYTLPFSPGAAYRVTQAYHGSYSHTGSEEYAIDWKMSIGTPVHAARDGVVVKVKDDSDKGGPYREYEQSANYILIQHADGTLANYAHLQKGGCMVKVGQSIRAGQPIARSGNTGFSTGPHLHFSVFKTKSGSERQSLPVRFHVDEGEVITLAEGHTYTSPGLQTASTGGVAPGSKPERFWDRLPILGRAQGGSRKAR